MTKINDIFEGLWIRDTYLKALESLWEINVEATKREADELERELKKKPKKLNGKNLAKKEVKNANNKI